MQRTVDNSMKKGGLFSVSSMTPTAAFDLPHALSERRKGGHGSEGMNASRLPLIKGVGHTSSAIVVGSDGTTGKKRK